MQWFFTGLLIVTSAGTAVFTCYLLRALFTIPPAPADTQPGAPT